MWTELFIVLGAITITDAAKARRTDTWYSRPDMDPFYFTELREVWDTSIYRSISLPQYQGVQSAYQVVFPTQNSQGGTTTGITTIIVPTNSDRKNVVSYQYSESANWLNCAPSWTIRESEQPVIAIQELLDRGWVVNIPDHEGLTSAFGSSIFGGRITLDSLKAVSKLSNITGIASPQFALWGYSGGSSATGWAAEHQEEYAPSLDIKGAAIGGYMVDLVSTSQYVNKGPWAGIAPALIAGISKEFESLAKFLESDLKEDRAAEFGEVSTQCYNENIAQFTGQDVFDLFKSGEDIFKAGSFEWALSQAKLGLNAPKVPLVVYQSRSDKVVPTKEVDDIVKFYCSNGGSVQYVQGDYHDHDRMATAYSSDVLHWFQDAFAGNVGGSCTYKNISSGFNPDPKKPDDTDPKKPNETDPKKPDETDPKKPDETDPKKPDETDPKKPDETDPKKPDETDPKEPDNFKPGDTDPKKPDDTKPDDTNPNTPVAPVPNTPNPNTPLPNTPNPNTPVTSPGSVSTPSSGSTSTSTRITSTPSTPSAVTTAPSAANLATTEDTSHLFIAMLAILGLLL